MDSNENTEDKSMKTSSEKKMSDASVQDNESEKQPDKENIEEGKEKKEKEEKEKVTQENKKSENVDSTSVKTNGNENKTKDLQNTDSAKINTLQNDSKATETEKKDDNEKSPKVSNVTNESESSEIDTSITSTPLKDSTKESRRKRKSTNTPPARLSPVEQNGSSASKRKKLESTNDRFCWRCHKESVDSQCSACPRSWHRRCMGGAPPLTATDNWICGECVGILQAENAETRSPAMAQLTIDQLCMMLRHIVERMRDQTGSEPFWKAVDLEEVPNYLEYVIKPMDLSLLESNVRAKMYGSTDAFMADAKWIQHNCIVFNTCGGVYTDTSKLTNTSKQMLKVARQEVSEIEACPDCFAHGRNLPRPLPSWFIEPCRRPHPIVWAKLKGFPFWPAKAMPRLNTQGLVDVRFFGEHDRAWVSPKDIYLYSHEPPAGMPRKKKLEMEQCVKEVEDHSKKLERVFGEFRYAPPKVPYDPHDPMQIQIMLPNYDPSKNMRIDIPKAEVATPVNNKTLPPKAEKKQQNLKNITTVGSTNGAIEVEKRSLLRKRKTVEHLDESVNKESPEIESVVVVSKRNSISKSPTTPESGSNISNSELSRATTSTPEIKIVEEVTNNSTSKKNITSIRKIKSDNIKKVKLMRDLDKEEYKKINSNLKNVSSKSIEVSKMPVLNSLQNNTESVKIMTTLPKPKTIYIQSNVKKSSNANLIGGKISVQTPQSENKIINRTLNKTISKELSKFSVNNKESPVSNKPMTAIPVSTKNNHSKLLYLPMNSSTSETAKQFNDKEKLSSTVTVKQEPKDDLQPKQLTIARKPGKARKSFPNKPPSFPQIKSVTSLSRPLFKSSSNASDAMVFIPPQSNELRSSSAATAPVGTTATVTTTTATTTTGSTSSTYVLPPPEAGPITAQIHQKSMELANRMAKLITDTIKEAAESNGLTGGGLINHQEATIHYLKLRMERMKWDHQQQISELKHNNELVLREVKSSMEVERYRALQDARREAEIEKARCIEETKRKQWCVVCGREAMFYCCWNTAYCDYPCQQKHWSSHIATCAQKSQSRSGTGPCGNSSSSTSTSSGSPPKAQQQVMPELVINRPHQSS